VLVPVPQNNGTVLVPVPQNNGTLGSILGNNEFRFRFQFWKSDLVLVKLWVTQSKTNH
jgi:hypothetical protein